MEVRFWINCFDRELVIKFPEGYDWIKEEIAYILDKAYDEWHDAENIENPEERAYVQDSCLEEYMMERLSETYSIWEEWTSIYCGDDPDEMEDEVYWIKNSLIELRTKGVYKNE